MSHKQNYQHQLISTAKLHNMFSKSNRSQSEIHLVERIKELPRWQSLGNLIRDNTSKIFRKNQHKENVEVVEVSINDDEFDRIMSELQLSGLKTNVGALEYLRQRGLEKNINCSKEQNEKVKKAKLVKTSNRELFDRKKSFRNMVAMSIVESSKTPIYRRDSYCQMRALKRTYQEDENLNESSIASVKKNKLEKKSDKIGPFVNNNIHSDDFRELDYNDPSLDNDDETVSSSSIDHASPKRLDILFNIFTLSKNNKVRESEVEEKNNPQRRISFTLVNDDLLVDFTTDDE